MMSFKSGYQGGPYFELLSTQGRDSMTNWKESSSGIKKTYEKDVKGFVLTLEGSPATTKLCSPKDQKQSLTLVQRFLVWQLFLPKGVDFSLELGVTDLGNNKRRILLSTAQKETQVTPLHAKFPLAVVRRAVCSLEKGSFQGNLVDELCIYVISVVVSITQVKPSIARLPEDCTPPLSARSGCEESCYNPPLNVLFRAHKRWLNLVIDMVSFVGETWTNQTFRCVDQISISANCKLRRVFTMRSQPPDTTNDDELYGCPNTNSAELDSVPKQCHMTPSVAQQTQVLTHSKIRYAERLRSAKGPALADQIRPGSLLDLDLCVSGRKPQVSDSKIAFGSKAPRAPDSSRKTLKQSGLTNRSVRSQTSQNENNSNGAGASMLDHTGNLDEQHTVVGQFDLTRPRPPASASAASAVSGLSSNTSYSRQQSEPVTQEDYGYITNGLREKHLAFQQPHPPREPSSDRVRRRPRIKSLGQNGAVGKGELSLVSPPTSAVVSQMGSRGSTAQLSVVSPGAARTSVGSGDARVRDGKRRDSGVGPDVPEIQSPRKGDGLNQGESLVYSEYDSVADVISLLSGTDMNGVDGGYSGDLSNHIANNSRRGKIENVHMELAMKEQLKLEGRLEHKKDEKKDDDGDDEDSNLSTSASESSHPGEYEESDEETSGERNKLHFFASPPKSAGMRRNLSPSTAEAEANKLSKSSLKSFRSNIKRAETSSNRGARLEDDFVSHNSSDDDPAVAADLLHHLQRSTSGLGSAGSQRHSNHGGHHNPSSGYNSFISLTSSPKSRGHSATKSRYANVVPKTSASPDQRPVFDPRLYSDQDDKGQDRGINSLSRMSKKSLREINNPLTEGAVTTIDSSEKLYDHTKYQHAEVTDSFEAGMLATMAQEAEDELEDVLPAPVTASHPDQSFQQNHIPIEVPVTHLYSESPATTSDDDTSLSTWKAPALNQIPHNYQDEMKSRRSSDTLTSSNPRDWSGVMSPPIGPLSGQRNLEGTMEGISDELSDDAPVTKGQGGKSHKNGEEEEKLDLLFDPKLNCYYDPKTKKWYELVS